MPLRRHIHRFLGLLFAGLVGMGTALSSGCLFLNPDAADAPVALHLKARVSGVEARRAPASIWGPRDNRTNAPCEPADSLLCNAELFAVARVWLLRAGEDCGATTKTLLNEAPMMVGECDEANDERLLTGELAVSRGGAGDRYCVTVDLLAQGTQLDGVYDGDLSLASGLGGHVDMLVIRDSTATIVVSAGNASSGPQTVHITPDPPRMSGQYEREIDYRNGRPTVVVKMTGGLEPTVIYTGSSLVEALIATPDFTEVDVDLVESGHVPGAAGERLTARVDVFFEDDDPSLPSETGFLDVQRNESACAAGGQQP